jgi:hypothetical protein
LLDASLFSRERKHCLRSTCNTGILLFFESLTVHKHGKERIYCTDRFLYLQELLEYNMIWRTSLSKSWCTVVHGMNQATEFSS